MSCSGIIMARLIVLVDFNAFTAFCDVDFRVMLRVVSLKVGSLIKISNSEVGEVVGSAMQLVIIGSVTFRLDIAYYLLYIYDSQNNSLLFVSLVWLRR
jgi:hypothetical protein